MSDLDRIQRDLDAIEREEGITLIAARDTGSHAWGLSGPHSDRDIRLIFIEDYDPNCIGTRTDSLSLNGHSDEDFEYDAWSLRRFAGLLRSSNPSALLFSASGARYLTEPQAFEELCEYALREFNPADAIGAHRGKAKDNYWKYLLPTLKHRGDTKEREFDAIEYEPEQGDGILTLQPMDDPDADTEEIHATHIGENNWRLIHEAEERHTWRITTDYDDPRELETASEITALHPDTGEERTLDPETIAPADANSDGEWEFRWGTNDRTIKRYLYIGEALMRADLIACTQTFPPADFDSLCDEYEQLDADKRYTDLPLETLREYAERKRAGEGGSYTPIPSQDALDEAIDNLLEAFQDPANHRGGPDTATLNDFIRSI